MKEGDDHMFSTSVSAFNLLPETDEEGFLTKPDTWTRDTAEALGQQEVPGRLTEDHWRVIDYLRDYYLKFDTVPPVRMLCRDTGLKYSRICRLFPAIPRLSFFSPSMGCNSNRLEEEFSPEQIRI